MILICIYYYLYICNEYYKCHSLLITIRKVERLLVELNDDENLWDELDQETQASIGPLLEPEYEEFFNSAWKGEDLFLQSGELTENDQHFVINETTDRDY